jgi:hypothetical protein
MNTNSEITYSKARSYLYALRSIFQDSNFKSSKEFSRSVNILNFIDFANRLLNEFNLSESCVIYFTLSTSYFSVLLRFNYSNVCVKFNVVSFNV